MSTTKVVTGKVRFSYTHVFEPHSVEEGQEKKFSTSILIPKKDKATIKKIEEAIAVAIEEGKAKKFGGKVPKNLKLPLRDGDLEKEDDDNYKGMYFINATTKTRPGVVDGDRNEIIDKEEFYSGCWGRASINFYAFDVSGNRGVAAGLNNVQKLEEGEKLGGGRSSAADDFGDDDEIF